MHVKVSSIFFLHLFVVELVRPTLLLNLFVKLSVERVFDLAASFSAVLQCIPIATANTLSTPTMSMLKICFRESLLSLGMINGHCKANCRTTFEKLPKRSAQGLSSDNRSLVVLSSPCAVN